MLLCPRQLQERFQSGLPALLCSRAEAHQPARHAAIHGGRQQDLQWLLERPAFSPEELQHILPGSKQGKWSKCRKK